jgi:UDP-N-acetylglucosamine 2-epimerase (non-hydrolysing)
MKDIAIILGIRPDVIRASKILKLLESSNNLTYDFIWSGQHYSENMKDVFFEQLNVPKPNVEFEIEKGNDAAIVSSVIKNTYNHLEKNKYKAVVFLGDTNTVMGSIAVAQHNIPIVHIEGCMRSYDWRMPEEKYRTTIDHLSDRIYAYLDGYKNQGLKEGISEQIIKVTGNPIVDIINENKNLFESGDQFLSQEISKLIEKDEFLLATVHRRENVLEESSLKEIVNLINKTDKNVIFPMGYTTQMKMKEFNLSLNSNVYVCDPIGYLEFMHLLGRSDYVLSDSGTVVEEACILGTASIQLRFSTERPEVYDVKSSVKFDPSEQHADYESFISKVESLKNTKWEQPFGDGRASDKIVQDLVNLSNTDSFKKHSPSDYPFDISNSFKG